MNETGRCLQSTGTPSHPRSAARICGLLLGLVLISGVMGCGESGNDGASDQAPAAKALPATAEKPASGASKAGASDLPNDLEMGLVLALSVFPETGDADTEPVPLPAELEFIVRRGGEWVKTGMTDADSNVFHKAMAYQTPSGETRLLTGAERKRYSSCGRKRAANLSRKRCGRRIPGAVFRPQLE